MGGVILNCPRINSLYKLVEYSKILTDSVISLLRKRLFKFLVSGYRWLFFRGQGDMKFFNDKYQVSYISGQVSGICKGSIFYETTFELLNVNLDELWY